MRYPIAIEPGDATHAFGVVVPDLPGCFSAGDTFDEALTGAEEAILLWLDQAILDGLPIPKPAPIEQHRLDPEFHGWIWAVVSVDLARLDKAERINITVPHRVLRIIDHAAERHGESRSGFLTHAALVYVEMQHGAKAVVREKRAAKKKFSAVARPRAAAKKRA